MGLLVALTGCAVVSQFLGGYDAPWRHLHAGMLAYIGNDNTDSNEARQTVCPTIDLVIRSWEEGHSKRCRWFKHGEPVTIEAIRQPRTGTTDSGDPLEWLGAFAKVRAIGQNREGYTPIAFLQPNIPVGAVIPMVRDSSGDLTIAPNYRAANLIDLATDVKVEVLAYYPQFKGDTLYVKVLDGQYKGYHGWMAIQEAEPPPALDHGLYGIVYP